MTKWSVFPRALGTLPAGSAVRVKSRFALYSASGVLAPRGLLAALPADLDDVFAAFFAALPEGGLVRDALLDDEARFAEADVLEPDPRFAGVPGVAVFLAVVPFVPERAPVRFVAMPCILAKTMPGKGFGPRHRRVETTEDAAQAGPSRARRDTRATAGVSRGRGATSQLAPGFVERGTDARI